ncbi:hypothetical protein [Nonomuraea diastatica]|nr:hypothetical protein [Nonomuraea diastatica]
MKAYVSSILLGVLPWGGYGGSFAGPDGSIWSLGYSAQGTAQGTGQSYAE